MSDDPDADADTDADAPRTDTPDDAPEPAMSTDTTDAPAPTDSTADSSDDDHSDLVKYARYALLGGLTLLALVATLRFYFAASNAIDIWVAREYRPLFQAAFNLVVLLLAAVGISWEIRQVAR